MSAYLRAVCSKTIELSKHRIAWGFPAAVFLVEAMAALVAGGDARLAEFLGGKVVPFAATALVVFVTLCINAVRAAAAIHAQQQEQIQQLTKAATAEAWRQDVISALLDLRHEGIHKILNVSEPTQDERGPLAERWMPVAHDWGRRVRSTMLAKGVPRIDVEDVNDFALPTGRPEVNKYTYPMNELWTICKIRNDRLEAYMQKLRLQA